MSRRVPRLSPDALAADDPALRRGLAAIRQELGVSDRFPAPVLAEADRAAARGPRPEAGPWQDRTALPLVTVDPDGARDLDQALHLERRGRGYRVCYAIADVAAFVRPGGAVDEEAHRRGETLYGLDAKVPLHPSTLSEDAGSLLAGRDRPALLWEVDLDADGERTAVRLSRALVRSRRRLAYAEVQADLDSGRAAESLVLLREVGLLRLARERSRGGVSLPLPDQQVERRGREWALVYRSPLPVEAWNAQVSLLTGMAAAEVMLTGRVGVLRTLAPADPRDLDRLHRVAAALGVTWPGDGSYPDLVASLDPGRPRHAALLVAATALLRGSGYAAFDGQVPDQPLHSALAAPYAHTTAPLRRLVDRYAGETCLALLAGRAVPDWVRSRLPTLPEAMRASARRAGAYERGVVDLVEALVLHGRLGESFVGSVVQVRDKRPDQGRVLLEEPAVEAPLESGDGSPLPLGARVTVRLGAADPAERRVGFTLER